MSVFLEGRYYLQGQINQTDLLAGTAQQCIAPSSGYIEEFGVVVQAAVTTGGPITVAVAPAAGGSAVPVAGLSVTVANAATAGTAAVDTPTEPSITRQVNKGDVITVIPDAAFATAGAVNWYVRIGATPDHA